MLMAEDVLCLGCQNLVGSVKEFFSSPAKVKGQPRGAALAVVVCL
jgi:hypothetical protein